MKIFVISLLSADKRRRFQQAQMNRLELSFEFLDAISVEDIDLGFYARHANYWQRPLRKTEVACYLSHRNAWQRISQNQEPALILEDDALLSKCVPKILSRLLQANGRDLVNLENRGRKKFVAKVSVDTACNSKVLRLYQDRTGAAGYVLYPAGAHKLLLADKRKGIALADAQITACYSLKAYQIEPSPVIQLDQCEHYGLNVLSAETGANRSTISTGDYQRGGLSFRVKRLAHQLTLGLRSLLFLPLCKKRYIELRKGDFAYSAAPDTQVS